MKFNIYAVRDVKVGFQSITVQPNDPVAARSFESTVINSDSILFTHAQDFALYRIGTWDSDTGLIEPENLPVLILEAASCLKGDRK